MRRQQQVIAGLFLGVVVGFAGCGPKSTGHTDDKTPGGKATPPVDTLMDQKAFDQYSKDQGKAARANDPNKKLGLPAPPM
jgi:hypothetical protein